MPTALLVTDGIWVVNEVRSALAVGDWHVEVVPSPDEALTRLDSSRVDVVIIDMQVGSSGGMAIVRAIRQATDFMTRPRMVLLLDRSADSFLAKRAGADAWVLKPINAASLRIAIGAKPTLVATGEEE